MGSAIRSFATVFGAVIVTFATTWALTFLLLPAYFSMFIGAYLQVKLTKKYADSSKKLIEDSAKVTSESIDNVYTVARTEQILIFQCISDMLCIEKCNDMYLCLVHQY